MSRDTPTRPRIAVFFYRLGPYHYARLRAAAQRMDVIAVEYTTEDTVYAWEKITGTEDFQRLVLFPGERIEVQSSRRVYDRVMQVLEKLHPTVVALAGWSDRPTMAGLKWCRQHGVPAIVMSESTAWDYARMPVKEAVKRHIVRQYSTGLVGGIPQRGYLATLGMPTAKIHLGYDAVDNAYFATETNRWREQAANCSPGNPPPAARGKLYFLASARFVPKKNLLFLLRCFARYRRQAGVGAPWDLVILGDGPLRRDVEELRTALGLGNCVHLPGFIQYRDLPHYYAGAGVFIHASSSEQWGLVVNEAMASGLPVLVSRTCGCAMDLVQEGVNGYTFAPTDIVALSEQMRTVAAADFSRAQFAAASRRIVADYGVEAFAAGLERAVVNALGERRIRHVFLYSPWIASLPGWPRSESENIIGTESHRLHQGMLLFSYRQRPVMAFPEQPAVAQRVFVERYKSNTIRRSMVRQLLRWSCRVGATSALCRRIAEPDRELLNFNYNVWKETLAAELDLPEVLLMIVWPSQLTRKRYYFHVFDRDLCPRGFVKLALLPSDAAGLDKEYSLLQWQGATRPEGIRTPRQLSCGTFEGGVYTIQEAIPSAATPPNWNSIYNVLSITRLWSGGEKHCTAAEIRDCTWWKTYEKRVAALGGNFHSELDSLLGDGAAMGRVHGDFSLANMVQDGANMWIYDWEYSHNCAPALTDAVGYYLSFGVGQVWKRPRKHALVFARRFLRGNRWETRLDVMLALAYRLSCNFPDTEVYIEHWAAMRDSCHE